jgi:hypothetical protein
MSELQPTSVGELARDWSTRLARADQRFRGDEIYGGRGFREATLAAELLDAKLMVVSAGLGLIDGSESVPPYACTVLTGAPDSVAGRVIDQFDAASWWRTLTKKSPFSLALHEVASRDDGLICAALSEAYINMIAEDLLGLGQNKLRQLRIFTRAPIEHVPEDLRTYMMPYDDRLDGPDSAHRGTRSDFASRALRHFVEITADDARVLDAEAHAEVVRTALAEWRPPTQFVRVRHDDATMLDLIRANWDAEQGSSSRLLRRLRDKLGVACEQGRFAQLARVVRSERT